MATGSRPNAIAGTGRSTAEPTTSVDGATGVAGGATG
jgi:hypothetical protein